MRPLRKPVAIERVTRPPGPLPHWMLAWPPEAIEDFEEMAGKVAADLHLPQRCERSERLAEALIRDEWLKFPKEIDR